MSHTLSVLAVALALLARATPAHAVPYPGAEWETASPASTGMDPASLKALEDYAFTVTDHRRTDGLVVIHQGKLVYEKYAYGYRPDMKHLSWSMAKSVTTLLAAVAESDGIISRNAKLVDFYPYPSSSAEEQARREKITLLSLLNMTSGIDWTEEYSAKGALKSDVIQMLYLYPRYDMGAYVASREVIHAPGEHYYYSTGNSVLAMAMLKQRMSREQYESFPWKRLFDRVGMKDVTFEQDSSGTLAGGSYVYATPRDYARLGYLLLQNGKWNDDQVIPTDWMKLIRSLNPGHASGSVKPSIDATYGTGFWLNLPAPRWNLPAPYPKAPHDVYFMLGHNGQSVAVFPSHDLVVVRVAHDVEDEDGDGISLDDYFALIARAVKSVPASEPRAVGNKPIIRDEPLKPIAATELPVPGAKRTSPIYYTKLIAAVRAKDFCSCHFVEGQSVDYCRALVKNGFPQVRMSYDEEGKTATFGIAPRQTARYVSAQFGCVLD